MLKITFIVQQMNYLYVIIESEKQKVRSDMIFSQESMVRSLQEKSLKRGCQATVRNTRSSLPPAAVPLIKPFVSVCVWIWTEAGRR